MWSIEGEDEDVTHVRRAHSSVDHGAEWLCDRVKLFPRHPRGCVWLVAISTACLKQAQFQAFRRVCDVTREDSDCDFVATQLGTQVSESDATPSLDGVDRRPVGNSGPHFVPWAGGTSSTPHEGDLAHVQEVETATIIL